MIILVIKNNVGPGNQMFMYARAYSLAKKYQQKILILSEISGYSVRQNILQKLNLDKKMMIGFLRLDWTQNQYVFRFLRKLIFDIILQLPFFVQIKQKAKDSRLMCDAPELRKHKIYVLDGYWECHEYFDEYRDDLVRQFVPNYPLEKEIQKTATRMQRENSVAVHIRKGDFTQFGRLISDDYYEQSIRKMRTVISNPMFYILTESEETKESYRCKKDFHIIDCDTETKYIDEWFLLSKCKHHIIANSTYSWWSSYVSNQKGKIVVFPSYEAYRNAEKNCNIDEYRNYYVEANIQCLEN